MTSRAKAKKTAKKRAQRATSNVFAMFDQAQIQEFKEAFNMIDQNRDGFVDKEDLHDMLASLGKCCVIVWGWVSTGGFKSQQCQQLLTGPPLKYCLKGPQQIKHAPYQKSKS